MALSVHAPVVACGTLIQAELLFQRKNLFQKCKEIIFDTVFLGDMGKSCGRRFLGGGRLEGTRKGCNVLFAQGGQRRLTPQAGISMQRPRQPEAAPVRPGRDLGNVGVCIETQYNANPTGKCLIEQERLWRTRVEDQVQSSSCL